MSSLAIIDEFLRSVVVLTLLIGYQKRYKTPGPIVDEYSLPDHIFASLGPPVRREGHTLVLLLNCLVLIHFLLEVLKHYLSCICT